jgi:Tfp pilus assembly protein PilX
MASRSRLENGFALITTLLSLLILIAMWILVFTVSTKDIRISTRTIGEKKAFAAMEAGIHRLNLNFNPDNLPAVAASNVPVNAPIDPDSLYTIGTPAFPGAGPMTLPIPGYAISGGQQWIQARYVANVTGVNTRFNSKVSVDTSVGYGPLEATTTYR